MRHRGAGDPSSSRKSPGRPEYDPITLERGVTHDTEFEKWANKVWNVSSGLGSEVSLHNLRKDTIIESITRPGSSRLYKVSCCWVSEFQSLPEVDANANAVVVQSIKLENEGWRDYDVTDPTERKRIRSAPERERTRRLREHGVLLVRVQNREAAVRLHPLEQKLTSMLA